MAPILGYWYFRGLGQQIRYLLQYTNTEYEEKRYRSSEAWLKDKYNLGLSFPNIPYYIDGDVKLTQCITILRYLGRKHALIATTNDEILRQDLIEQQIIHLRQYLVRILYYSGEYEKDIEQFIKLLPSNLRFLNEFLGNRPWIVGEKLTYADFMVYDVLDILRTFQPGCLEDYPPLELYLKRFESLDAISKYMNSGEYIKWPIFAPFSKFGGDPKHTHLVNKP